MGVKTFVTRPIRREWRIVISWWIGFMSVSSVTISHFFLIPLGLLWGVVLIQTYVSSGYYSAREGGSHDR